MYKYSFKKGIAPSNLESSLLHHGTQQGCPLSPLLFALAIEPLALAIRTNNSFKGITRGRVEHKLSLYTDDLLLYISAPERSIPHILALLSQFGEISGYKVNMHKSELLPMDACLDYITSATPFKIANHSFVYLVIIIGRVNTIKMSVLPRFIYLFQCFPVVIPGAFFKKLDSAVSTCIWNGKKPRLKKDHLRKSKQDGGLALPNIQHYYWVSATLTGTRWGAGYGDLHRAW
uniref:Reverse transcriptase domain-containing protein n=1 Tax=Poecilia latipinna TaxID=48699 RepID=A0A3B3UGS4_9TELE